MARYLIGMNIPFVIHNPPELRDALLRMSRASQKNHISRK